MVQSMNECRHFWREDALDPKFKPVRVENPRNEGPFAVSAQFDSLGLGTAFSINNLVIWCIKENSISPKQLGKVIRLQSALKIMLNEKKEGLTDIAYNSKYYDQSHFIKDFKEFTGISPKEFLGSKNMALSSLFYK